MKKVGPRLVIRKPVSIRKRVYDVVREGILNGEYPAGYRMVESRLAKEIKTSRTPVREALHMLEMEGLLESIPRVGYRVKPIEWEEVEEICQIRAVNETLAAKWAMQRISNKEIEALEKNVAVAEEEVLKGKPKFFVESDAEFHDILARASGSKRLLELCQLLRRHMLRYRIESLYLRETALKAIDGHRRILDCFKKRDEKGIEEAICQHLEQSKRDIQRYAFHMDQEKKLNLLRDQ
jgi:DNA-binding GntR family transcriptional regulator